MKSNVPPTEPKLEDFSLKENDLYDYKQYKKQQEHGAGCSFVSYLFGAGFIFFGVLVIGALPTSCSGADGSILVTIAGVIALFAFLNFYKKEAEEKIELSDETIQRHSK